MGSDIGGIPELIRDGATGYIFRPGDAVALTEQVIRHIAHSAYERRAMRRRCAEYARAHLSLAHYLNRIQRAYGKALRN